MTKNYRALRAFTLIELVIVIAIIGILAALALPKFIDMSGASKSAAAKAGLGTLRSVLATKYSASATAGSSASYPTSLAATDFAAGDLPKNPLPATALSGVTALAGTVSGTTISGGTAGFWYVSDSASGDYGKAGTYSDGTTNTSTF